VQTNYYYEGRVFLKSYLAVVHTLVELQEVLPSYDVVVCCFKGLRSTTNKFITKQTPVFLLHINDVKVQIDRCEDTQTIIAVSIFSSLFILCVRSDIYITKWKLTVHASMLCVVKTNNGAYTKQPRWWRFMAHPILGTACVQYWLSLTLRCTRHTSVWKLQFFNLLYELRLSMTAKVIKNYYSYQLSDKCIIN